MTEKTTDNLYRVIKCESNTFTLEKIGERISAVARKKFKRGGIVAGDFVSVEKEGGGAVITEIAQRKNYFIRPLSANIDCIVIMVAPQPQPDFFLIDKLIINALRQNVEAVICLNKTDISDSLIKTLIEQYGSVVDKIVGVSAKEGDLEPLKGAIAGKLSCFAGQSAVGKSSVSNALLSGESRAVGELSEKIMRGKNTTTKAEILTAEPNIYIIDTPGFSMLDIFDIRFDELDLYYPEYLEPSHSCRYHRCTHTSEPDCKVKALVEEGKLNKERYLRYKQLFEELKSRKQY